MAKMVIILCFGILIGWIIGYIITRTQSRQTTIGELYVDCSENPESPELYLGFYQESDIDEIQKSEYVSLKVKMVTQKDSHK